MQIAHVRVLLGHPEDTPADLIVRPGWRAADHGRTVVLAAPRWRVPNGPPRALAEAYRSALALTTARQARVLVLPAILARGAWPLDEVTRIGLGVLLSTPTSAHDVLIVVGTPAMLERWAEALVPESRPGGPSPWQH